MSGAYGLLPRTHDARDYQFAPPTRYAGEFVDLSDRFPEPPYDQGQLGSCVSNGTAAAVDFARLKEGLTPFDRPSRLFIYFEGRKETGQPISEDTGLQIRDGFHVISTVGAPPETDWPYDISRFADRPPTGAYSDAKTDVAVAYGAVKLADVDHTIASGFPVVVGFDVYESFESQQVADTGVMPVPGPGERQVGGHCVVVVSTGKDGAEIPGGAPGVTYRKIRNSWGTSWGDRGFFWMPDEVLRTMASDFWVVTAMSSPDKPVPPKPGPTPGPAPSPTDPFDAVIAGLRKAWAALDGWLKRHGL